MAADARIVRQRLRRLLQNADMESSTQRTLTQQLEAELGLGPGALAAHKPLIKEEIDIFLQEQEDEAGSDDDFDEPAPPAAKKQRGAGGAAAPPSRPADALATLSALRFACVRQYGGHAMADIREWYKKEGALQPGAKGVALTAAAWDGLVAQMPALTAGLEAGDEGAWADLGASKRASVTSFKGRCNLDLREFYEKEGEMRPGKKGIALAPEEWAALCAAAPHISSRLHATAGSGQGNGAAAAAPAAPPAAAAASAGGGGAAGGGSVELSSSRRAELSTFKGTTYVSIREFYEKDGQKLPGKKGISLPKDQFEALRSRAADLDAALRGRDLSFEVQLSAKRKATVSCFKGKHYINIREYYEKEGQMLPGQKGISLPEEQWARLLGALPGLTAALEAA